MKTVIKTYHAKVERGVDDNLGLSAQALQDLHDLAGTAFRDAMMEALTKDGILPRRVAATFKFAIEGPAVGKSGGK